MLVRNVRADTAGPLIVRLPAQPRLTGRVLGEGGEPEPWFQVSVRPWAEAAARASDAERDELRRLAELHGGVARGTPHHDGIETAMQRLAALTTARRQREREQFPFGVDRVLCADGRDGTFSLSLPGDGSFVIEVVAPGYRDLHSKSLVLPPRPGGSGLELRLRRSN